MIARLKPYPKYKDSGVPWLGEVPAHWGIQRLKAVFREVDRRSATGSEKLLSLRMHRGLVDHHATGGTPITAESLVGYKHTEPGEIVMNRMRAAAGLFAATPSVGIVSPDYAVLRPIGAVELGYYVYLFRTPMMTSIFRLESRGLGTGESGFLRLYTERFGMLTAPTPPLAEQKAIIGFLDHVDRRIRRYIRAKQKLIKLMEEQGQAIIERAVTRGLDPNVRLKPSTVEWLGDIPDHWEVRKLRQCGSIAGGMTPSMEIRRFWDGALPWVTPKDMKRTAIGDSKVRVTNAAVQETSLRLIGPPAILMVVRGMILARKVPIAWTTAPVTINQDMKAIVPLRGIRAEFLARALASAHKAFVPLIDESGHGTRRLPTERWRDLPVAVPPEDEQVTIVRFLDYATQAIVAAGDRAEHEIDLMREYRARLIADVVTGKLDMRVAAAQLPEEAEQEEMPDVDAETDAETDAEEEAAVDTVPEEAEA